MAIEGAKVILLSVSRKRILYYGMLVFAITFFCLLFLFFEFLFIMFITSLFFLFMTFVAVNLRLCSWPHGTSILFATCSGVILGGQLGTRLIRYQWFRERQKHAFILLLAMSIIHLLW